MIEPVVIKWSDHPSHKPYCYDILDIENMQISEISSDEFIANPKLETRMLPLAEVSTYHTIWGDVLDGVVLATNEKVSDYISRYYPELLL